MSDLHVYSNLLLWDYLSPNWDSQQQPFLPVASYLIQEDAVDPAPLLAIGKEASGIYAKDKAASNFLSSLLTASEYQIRL